MSSQWKIIGILAGIVFLLSCVPIVGLFALIITAFVAVVVSNIAAIWLIVVAFQDEAVQGLLCLFVPFYQIYYVANHWETCKQPVMLWLTCITTLFASLAGAGVQILLVSLFQ